MNKKITILGNELSIAFNMAVQIEFEDLSGHPFDFDILDTQKATMQLCYASLKASNENVPFTFDEMIKQLGVEETANLKTAVIEAMNDWFNVPKVLQEQQQKQSGDTEKN